MHAAPGILLWGEGPTLRKRPYRVGRVFKALAKRKKYLKFSEGSNSSWEGTRREKTGLKKLASYFLNYLARTKYMHVLLRCTVLLTIFLEVQIMHIKEKGKKGNTFQLCHQFLAAFLLDQDVAMPK